MNIEKKANDGDTIEVPVTPEPVEPVKDPGPSLEELTSFAYRTKNYDMLSVEKTKEWLRDHHYTVTKSGESYTVQRNYVSGNVRDTRTITISAEGSQSSLHLRNSMMTTDDNGMLRVGFFKE